MRAPAAARADAIEDDCHIDRQAFGRSHAVGIVDRDVA
jgi:hypothetical protein